MPPKGFSGCLSPCLCASWEPPHYVLSVKIKSVVAKLKARVSITNKIIYVFHGEVILKGAKYGWTAVSAENGASAVTGSVYFNYTNCLEDNIQLWFLLIKVYLTDAYEGPFRGERLG